MWLTHDSDITREQLSNVRSCLLFYMCTHTVLYFFYVVMILLHGSGRLSCSDIINSNITIFRWYNVPLQGLYLRRTTQLTSVSWPTLKLAITEFEMTKSLGQLTSANFVSMRPIIFPLDQPSSPNFLINYQYILFYIQTFHNKHDPDTTCTFPMIQFNLKLLFAFFFSDFQFLFCWNIF